MNLFCKIFGHIWENTNVRWGGKPTICCKICGKSKN